jgi:hypothetical protein
MGFLCGQRDGAAMTFIHFAHPGYTSNANIQRITNKTQFFLLLPIITSRMCSARMHDYVPCTPKVATDMGFSAVAPTTASTGGDGGGAHKSLAMVSFHSISKGFIGECGIRGGYFELFGFPADVKAQVSHWSASHLS